MSFKVGIDLGTTFCAVAYIDPATGLPEILPGRDGGRITPSVIQFKDDGSVVVGSEAASAFDAGMPGCAATFKRYMGTDEICCYSEAKEYTAEELSTILLRRLKEDAEAALGGSIEEAVITVPAYFYNKEREATIRAAEKAGLKVKQIIDEPNAAAAAYGLNFWRENARILVYDLGGGTFDVTLITMERGGNLRTLVTRGNHILGGKDWDECLIEILTEKFCDEMGEAPEDIDTSVIRGMAEGVKKSLSKVAKTTVSAFFPEHGKYSVEVTRAEFEERTKDLLEQTIALCKGVLEDAAIRERLVTDVLLIGGSTRMPMVSERLTKMFGKKPITHVNPDEAVALGAAIKVQQEDASYIELSIEQKNGKKVTKLDSNMMLSVAPVRPAKKLSNIGEISLRETTAHAMGMIARDVSGTKYINDIIIPANHPRPVKSAKAYGFRTSRRGTNEMEIYVLQGDKEAPLENVITYRYVVTGIAHKKETKGQTIIKVQYSYDINGVISVEARQEDDPTPLPIRCEPVPEDVSKFALPIEEEEAVMVPEDLNVVLAIDVSGSMGGDPMVAAKDAMESFIRDMDFSYTRLGILTVSDSVNEILPLSDNEERCIKAVRGISVGIGGIGNSAHPYDVIKKMLEGEEGRTVAIILADGVWSYQEAAIQAAKACNTAGIETAAIGFGSADEAFLRAVSSDEASALLVAQEELSGAFGTIAQSLGGNTIESGSGLLSVADTKTW